MLLQLLQALNTTDLLKVVTHLSLPPLDIDLLFYQAAEDGEVKIDKATNQIEALKKPEKPYYEPELAGKLLAIIKRYDEQEANITYTRLEQITLDLAGRYGYPIQDFICTLYCLEHNLIPDFPKVYAYELTAPKHKKRPENTFKFFTLLDHQEFGAKAVNQYIASWTDVKVK